MTPDPAKDAITVIGIDFSTEAKNVGIADGVHTHDKTRVERVRSGKSIGWDGIVTHVAGLISDSEADSILLALDAPLGWPRVLGGALHDHRAGAILQFDADELFRRRTDDMVYEKLGKRPFDVGADKLARTAHKALWFLNQVRERTELEVPLAWLPGRVSGVEAIEVYPAATVVGRFPKHKAYKSKDGRSVRRDLVEQLASIVELPSGIHDQLVANDDLLDAVLCAVAGADFAVDDVISPTALEREQAQHEGWIWVKPPK